MSGQLAQFVNPITGPLGDLQGHFSQFASLHREAHTRLFTQGNNLTQASGIDAFAGEGAKSFSQIIDFCVGASESCLQGLDQAATSVGRCAADILEAVAFASMFPLNEGMVAHVLANLTHDEVICEGGNAVSAIINDMRNALNELAHSGGDFFGNLIHGHFAAATSDAEQEIAESARLVADSFALLADLEQALVPWAQRISEVVWACLKFVGEIAWKFVDAFVGITDIINDIKTLFNGKASLTDKLWALGDLVLHVSLDALMFFGIGELARGAELAFEGSSLLIETTAEDGVLTSVISETSVSGTIADGVLQDVVIEAEDDPIIIEELLPAGEAGDGVVVHSVEEILQVTIEEPAENPAVQLIERAHTIESLIKFAEDIPGIMKDGKKDFEQALVPDQPSCQ
jgi:hypothetical protein